MAELGQADLDELVEEAIADAHDEDEQLAGFYTMIEESLALPFTTRVLLRASAATGSGIWRWSLMRRKLRSALRSTPLH